MSILMLLLYLSTMGVMTIVESKMLGGMQLSTSVFKFSLLGIYHFYLDFLKVLFKGLLHSGSSSISSYVFILMVLILISMTSIFMLLVSISLKSLVMQSLLLMLLLDLASLVIKIYLLNTMGSKYMEYTTFSVKTLYLLLEGLFSYVMFVILILMNLLKVNEFLSMKFDLYVFSMISMLYLVMVMKVFSVPFDYLEVESEMNGGVSLEMQGLGFLLWSLLEYGVMFNNVVFIIYMVNICFSISWMFNTFLTVFSILLLMILSGFLVSMSFSSVMKLVILGYLMMTMGVFLGVILGNV